MTNQPPAQSHPLRPEDFGIGQLFARVSDAIVVREVRGNRIVLWNPAAEEIFGYSEADIRGSRFDRILPDGPSDHSGVEERRALHKSGRSFFVEVSVSPIGNALVPGDYDLAIIRDVSNRVRDRQALEERAELLDVTHDAIFMLDPSLHIQYWNRGAEKLYGWSAEEASGRVLHELLHTRFETSLEALLSELERDGSWEGELVHTRRDGSQLVVASRWVLRRDEQGKPCAIMDTNNDITARKQAQAELQAQADALRIANAELREADRYKDDFLSNLSHELRTPLNFILASASMLDEEISGPLNAMQRDFVAKVMLGADRLLGLVDNLLVLTRIAADKLTLSCAPTLYGALVEQVIEAHRPAARARDVELAAALEVPGEVGLDADLIKRVLANLLDNAIKFTEPGGRVEVRAYLDGDRLVTEVRDTGVGIAPEDLPRLFQRFKQLDMSSTRKAGGLGVGLSLSKTLVECHGGWLEVETQPGRGSTFRFVLPVRDLEAP